MNLYEFEKIAAKKDAPLEELIENIDIGGPTMIRAAAKNWQDVAVVTAASDYAAIVEELQASGGALSAETHWRLAKKAFATTAAYDRACQRPPGGDSAHRRSAARDPGHSSAAQAGSALRREPASVGCALCDGGAGIAGAEQLHGKELSYNNLVDLDAAWQLIARV